jgi:pyruvate dehydrogenase E1 component
MGLGITYFEPAFADELALIMRWAFDHLQAGDGGSTYLRLTTRVIQQAQRSDDFWEAGTLAGGYWLRPPGIGAEAAIVATGAIMPEAIAAWEELQDDLPGIGLLNVTSPDLLHRGWSAARAGRWVAKRSDRCHAAQLLGALSPTAGLVTIIDGSPGTLSWLGGVRGQRVSSLGIDRFGQTGDLPDVYREYRLDKQAIFDAAAELFL